MLSGRHLQSMNVLSMKEKSMLVRIHTQLKVQMGGVKLKELLDKTYDDIIGVASDHPEFNNDLTNKVTITPALRSSFDGWMMVFLTINLYVDL